MPELPEVERLVQSLKPVVTKRTIEQVSLSDTLLTSHENGKECIIKGIQPELLTDIVQNMKISSIERRSKYIYFHVRKGYDQYVLVSHLSMSGAWFHVPHLEAITENKFRKHAHISMQLDDGNLLVYADIRRFGELRLLKEISDFPPLLHIAPEPFDDGSKEFFLDMCEKPKYRKKPIKEVIMDSHVVCGCGNIYATEALFKMKIHPGRVLSNIDKATLSELFDTIVAVLYESIAFGGSTISDYRNINGESGSMQNRLKMYGMKICPMCHTNTMQIKIAGRNSYYCPSCQK